MSIFLGYERAVHLPLAAAACFVAFLVLNIFSGNWGYLGVPLGPDRVMFAASVALWWVGTRSASPRVAVRMPFGLPMAALTAFAFISALSHGTLATSLGFFGLLDRLLVPFLAFHLASELFRDRRAQQWLLWSLVWLGAYLGSTAIFEVIGPRALVFPRFIVDPDAGIHFGRARGPFLSAAPEGTVLAFCAAAAVVAAAQSSGLRRFGAVLVVTMCSIGILLSLTRSIWLGASLGAVLAVAATSTIRRWLPAIALLGAVGVGVALAAVPGLSTSVSERASDTAPIWDRNNTNAAAVRAIVDHPLVGIGWARFIPDSDEYLLQGPNYPLTGSHIEVHNVGLSRAAELGLPAGLLNVYIVGGAFVSVLRERIPAGRLDVSGWRIIFLVGGSCWLVTTLLTPAPQSLPAVLYWALAGVCIALASRKAQDFGRVSFHGAAGRSPSDQRRVMHTNTSRSSAGRESRRA